VIKKKKEEPEEGRHARRGRAVVELDKFILLLDHGRLVWAGASCQRMVSLRLKDLLGPVTRVKKNGLGRTARTIAGLLLQGYLT